MKLVNLAVILGMFVPAAAIADPPKPPIGMMVIGLTPELREFYGAPKDSGLLVARVEQGGFADHAGLKVGDVIVKLDGKALGDAQDIVDAWSKDQDQDKSQVAIEVVRAKGTVDLQAKLDTGEDKNAPVGV